MDRDRVAAFVRFAPATDAAAVHPLQSQRLPAGATAPCTALSVWGWVERCLTDYLLTTHTHYH